MIRCQISDVLNWLKSKDLIKSINISKGYDHYIDALSDTSKEIKPNTLFFCKGANFKKIFLEEAISKGIVLYITERYDLLGFENHILVKDIRKAMAFIAGKFYNESWKKLTLIGITGTKGKSTTAYMTKSIIDNYLQGSDKKCGILSSIENYDGEVIEESHLTTLEPIQLHEKFYHMVKNHCSYCVMEVSSQALKYDRVFGIEFDLGVFLNIGEDHISDIEHHSFEDYYQSKLMIFDYSKKVVVSSELDIQDHKAIYFGKIYGKDELDLLQNDPIIHYRYSNIQINPTSIDFSIKNIGDLTISMPGLFNVENAAASAVVCKEINIPFKNIYDGLKSVTVSGRMELFRSKTTQNIAIVDYAHNKLSYEALFQSIKEYEDYKIITIFGCPGKKAIQRRKELPAIAEKFSDYIYITEEDPGEEALDTICHEIYTNIENKTLAEIVLCREEAIKKSFLLFKEPTLVLVLGKGRETNQKRGKKYVDFPSDVDLVQKYIL